MLRQIRYFQSVVQNNSFSEAAEACHISQSAISQQIKALENELGFPLLERKNRTFSLTPAGEHFYKKSLILTADYDRMCSEADRISRGDAVNLKIGYLRTCDSREFGLALDAFTAKYPHVSIQLLYGNHEELFTLLRAGGADLVFNDQRRAFSDEYVNLILRDTLMYAEISTRSPISGLPFVTTHDLKNVSCILVASREQQEIERDYYQTVIGIQSGILYAESLEEAHLMVISGQGFLPVQGRPLSAGPGASIRRIPLYRNNSQLSQKDCLFWKKANSRYYIEEFADILKKQYEPNV